MSSLYRTAFRVDMKNAAAKYEQKRPRIEKSRSHRLTDCTESYGTKSAWGQFIILYSSVFSRTFNMAAKDFLWTDDELDLVLNCAVVYKSKWEYEGLSWEGTRTKNKKMRKLI